MIDRQTIEHIIDASQIVEVVSEFVQLKKRGVNYLGLCPFHNEKTPSFTVSPAKDIFKCFGCGKAGNSVNFIMEHEHLTYPEALKYLAKKYHIEVNEKELTKEELEKQNERESLLVLSAYAARQFTENLFSTDEGISVGLTYFKERGFRQDTLKKFEVGYSFERRDSFTKKALEDGYQSDYLVKTGLSIQHEDRFFDRFAGRVMFPIHSLSGQVLGFGGRVLKKDAKTAKYLNSPESEIYHKSRILYGMYQARKTITQDDRCYMVEGYTDVMSMHEAGVFNVVASSGTSLTQEQIRLVKRFTPNMTILYDGDAAGIKASIRGIDLVLEEGMNVKIVLLPDGEDPDSYSRKVSNEEFHKYLKDNETDFIRFKTKLLLQEAGTDPLKRAELIRDVVKSIAVIPDSITRTIYIKECSTYLEVAEPVIYNEVNKLLRQKNFKDRNEFPKIEDLPVPPPFPAKPDITPYTYEKEVIRLLLKYGNNILENRISDQDGNLEVITVSDFIISEIANDDLSFENDLCSKIFSDFRFFSSQGMLTSEKQFIKNADPEISKLATDLLIEPHQLSMIWKDIHPQNEEDRKREIIDDAVLVFKRDKLKNSKEKLITLLQEAHINKDIIQSQNLQKRLLILNSALVLISKKIGGGTRIT